MHRGIIGFLKKHKDLCSEGDEVLEVGSLNVNGTARRYLPVTVGVDMREGDGVDVVCKGEELSEFFPPEIFDVVVSTDTLEHVEYWREFLQGIWYVLKPGGHLIITIASKGKRRHAYPDDYWRLEEEHLDKIFPLVEHYERLGVSTGWVAKKVGDLFDLTEVHLDPVDKKVPEHLLPKDNGAE